MCNHPPIVVDGDRHTKQNGKRAFPNPSEEVLLHWEKTGRRLAGAWLKIVALSIFDIPRGLGGVGSM